MSNTNTNGYQGAGWYTIGYSDGGQDYTDGAIWIDDAGEFEYIMRDLTESGNEYHLPVANYYGDGRWPNKYISVNPNWLARESWYIYLDAVDMIENGTHEPYSAEAIELVRSWQDANFVSKHGWIVEPY